MNTDNLNTDYPYERESSEEENEEYSSDDEYLLITISGGPVMYGAKRKDAKKNSGDGVADWVHENCTSWTRRHPDLRAAITGANPPVAAADSLNKAVKGKKSDSAAAQAFRAVQESGVRKREFPQLMAMVAKESGGSFKHVSHGSVDVPSGFSRKTGNITYKQIKISDLSVPFLRTAFGGHDTKCVQPAQALILAFRGVPEFLERYPEAKETDLTNGLPFDIFIENAINEANLEARMQAGLAQVSPALRHNHSITAKRIADKGAWYADATPGGLKLAADLICPKMREGLESVLLTIQALGEMSHKELYQYCDMRFEDVQTKGASAGVWAGGASKETDQKGTCMRAAAFLSSIFDVQAPCPPLFSRFQQLKNKQEKRNLVKLAGSAYQSNTVSNQRTYAAVDSGTNLALMILFGSYWEAQQSRADGGVFNSLQIGWNPITRNGAEQYIKWMEIEMGPTDLSVLAYGDDIVIRVGGQKVCLDRSKSEFQVLPTDISYTFVPILNMAEKMHPLLQRAFRAYCELLAKSYQVIGNNTYRVVGRLISGVYGTCEATSLAILGSLFSAAPPDIYALKGNKTKVERVEGIMVVRDYMSYENLVALVESQKKHGYVWKTYVPSEANDWQKFEFLSHNLYPVMYQEKKRWLFNVPLSTCISIIMSRLVPRIQGLSWHENSGVQLLVAGVSMLMYLAPWESIYNAYYGFLQMMLEGLPADRWAYFEEQSQDAEPAEKGLLEFVINTKGYPTHPQMLAMRLTEGAVVKKQKPDGDEYAIDKAWASPSIALNDPDDIETFESAGFAQAMALFADGGSANEGSSSKTRKKKKKKSKGKSAAESSDEEEAVSVPLKPTKGKKGKKGRKDEAPEPKLSQNVIDGVRAKKKKEKQKSKQKKGEEAPAVFSRDTHMEQVVAKLDADALHEKEVEKIQRESKRSIERLASLKILEDIPPGMSWEDFRETYKYVSKAEFTSAKQKQMEKLAEDQKKERKEELKSKSKAIREARSKQTKKKFGVEAVNALLETEFWSDRYDDLDGSELEIALLKKLKQEIAIPANKRKVVAKIVKDYVQQDEESTSSEEEVPTPTDEEEEEEESPKTEGDSSSSEEEEEESNEVKDGYHFGSDYDEYGEWLDDIVYDFTKKEE